LDEREIKGCFSDSFAWEIGIFLLKWQGFLRRKKWLLLRFRMKTTDN
jgi:hypothetical protein